MLLLRKPASADREFRDSDPCEEGHGPYLIYREPRFVRFCFQLGDYGGRRFTDVEVHISRDDFDAIAKLFASLEEKPWGEPLTHGFTS